MPTLAALAFALQPAAAFAGDTARPVIRLAQAGPVAPDERFWMTIKNSSLPDLFEMFIKRYPDSARRTEAEARLASLRSADKAQSAQEQADSMLQKPATRSAQEDTNPVTTGSTPSTRSAAPAPAAPVTEAVAPKRFPTRSEIMVIQAELLRVGCLRDTVDGIWGPKTQAAAAKFASSSGIENRLAVPGFEILDALRKSPGQVCAQTASVTPSAPARTSRPAAAPAVRRATTRSAPPSRPKTTAKTEPKKSWAKQFLDSSAISPGGGGGGGGGGW